MLSNYITLFHISKLLHQRFAHTVIAEVYSQEKNTLSIIVYAPEPHTITISCNSRENYITAKIGNARTHKNTVDLFPELIDKHIESVYIGTADRVIYFKLSGSVWLLVEMFASKANVILTDMDGTIIDTFLNKKTVITEKRELQITGKEITIEEILPLQNGFELVSSGSNGMVKDLKKAFPKLGTLLAEEVQFRTVSDKSTEKNYNGVLQTAKKIVSELLSLKNISPSIYFEEKSPLCFSLIPLEHLSSYRQERFDDLFTGIQKFISMERSSSTFVQKKKELTDWLKKEIERTVRTVRSVETELAESSRAEQYELYANLIMTHLQTIQKGAKTVRLENPFAENETVTIPLDASLSVQKNAEKYYEKAKKSKIGREESRERLVFLKQRMISLNDLLEKFNRIVDSISHKKFLQSFGGMVKELGFMTEKEHEELPPFKIFTVDGGFTAYAGKNSANNDLLTFRYAKPNDLWFHARGSSGSHVVLKIGSAQGTPTKKAIEQAASIAAYYSKMKNAKHVPVAMTERKYIHKPKGAPAGTVALDKEKVIFVQPVLPQKE